MSDIEQTTRIELIRDSKIVGTVVPKGGSDSGILNMTSRSSLGSFPSASFKSSNSELNQVFLGFSKLDLLRISICNSKDNSVSTMFEGEFLKKDIENGQNNIVLSIQAVHSFFRLSLFEVSSAQEFNNISFKQFVDMLVDLAVIKSKILIGEKLGNSLVQGLSKKTNGFRLFKEVCLIKNAVATFNADNSVNIDERHEKNKEVMSRAPVYLSEKDLVSYNLTDNIMTKEFKPKAPPDGSN